MGPAPIEYKQDLQIRYELNKEARIELGLMISIASYWGRELSIYQVCFLARDSLLVTLHSYLQLSIMTGFTLRTALVAAVTFGSASAATKTPAGVIAIPLTRDEGLTAYFAKLQVGTPLQTQYLKIDTGSPRYSFLDPRNKVCQRDGDPCREYGTFNNETSSYVILEASAFSSSR
jgi:hypothetical protein